jgi:hypothetical protein
MGSRKARRHCMDERAVEAPALRVKTVSGDIALVRTGGT